MFKPMVQKLLNVEKFWFLKLNQIKLTNLRKLGCAFGVGRCMMSMIL
jgi:hypothetical protein